MRIIRDAYDHDSQGGIQTVRLVQAQLRTTVELAFQEVRLLFGMDVWMQVVGRVKTRYALA